MRVLVGVRSIILYKFPFLFAYVLYQYFCLFLAQKYIYIYGRRSIL